MRVCVCVCVREREREREAHVKAAILVDWMESPVKMYR